MKFYPPGIVRFFYRYAFLFLLIILPFALGVDALISYRNLDGIVDFIICSILAIIGAALIHIGFWERFFAILVLTNDEVRWKCLFRKTRVIHLSKCMEIGAYLENTKNGIPSEQIYFSDQIFSKINMNKNGIMKPSQHLIKFWYSAQLCDYIIHNYPSKLTSCLNAYCRQRKKK